VAEHALLLALSALRHQNAWRPFLALPVAERQTESLCTRSLFRQKVGLHGFGGIARALLTLLRPFGVSVHAYSAGVPSTMIESEGVKACASLDELFRQSEILFECEALTVANERTVSAAVLAALPDGAVFVNVGRGRVVEEGALAKEAASGRIRIALDVTDETITPKSELFNIPDAILSPHIGGPSHDQYHQCGTLALQNIARFVRGETPHALVTLAIYDRST
jgi:phosphoglycerate dehydrogenase-like enzyme